LPSVVGCAGTLWVRPVIIRSRNSSERRASASSAAAALNADDLERLEDLELLDVLGQVAAGEAEVDELALRQLREFLDPRLHVVERRPLPLGDRLEVDVPLDALVVP
jgi:hypothetical protein